MLNLVYIDFNAVIRRIATGAQLHTRHIHTGKQMIFTMNFFNSRNTAAALDVLVFAGNKLSDRARQLINKAQELHRIDKEGNCNGFADAAMWSALVGLTVVEGAAIVVSLLSVWAMSYGLAFGIAAGRWYYSGGDEVVASFVYDVEGVCDRIGVWIGTQIVADIRCYRAVCLCLSSWLLIGQQRSPAFKN